MKRNTIISLSTAVAVLLVPAMAFAVTIATPTNPLPQTQGLQGADIVNLIARIVQYVVEVSVVIAVGYFIYGAIRFAMGAADEGKGIMWNAVIGLVAMLAVGLLVSTINRLIQNNLAF